MPESDSAISVLRLRYANGELTEEQFRSMSAVLSAGSSHTPPGRPQEQEPLVEALGLKVYDAHLTYTDKNGVFHRVPFSEVHTIIGFGFQSSYNFIDRSNHSYYHIGLTADRIISLQSQQSYIGESIHKKIGKAVGYIQAKTFQSRLERSVAMLKSAGEIVLAGEFGGEPKIALTFDGRIREGDWSYHIASCAAKGILLIGTKYKERLGAGYGQNPNEVVVSDHKGLFGGVPRSALRFITVRDVDVIHSLIAAFARHEQV